MTWRQPGLRCYYYRMIYEADSTVTWQSTQPDFALSIFVTNIAGCLMSVISGRKSNQHNTTQYNAVQHNTAQQNATWRYMMNCDTTA